MTKVNAKTSSGFSRIQATTPVSIHISRNVEIGYSEEKNTLSGSGLEVSEQMMCSL
jgi:hypothetical protein